MPTQDPTTTTIRLSEPERQTLRAKAVAEFQRRDLMRFIRANYPGFEEAWFHRTMAYELRAFSNAVVARANPRLMINLPPRHGKSSSVARFLAWHLIRNPSHEIILASYGADLANELSANVRRLVEDASADWPDELTKDAPWGVERWRLKAGGQLLAVGRTGPMTGRGAHIFVVDDLIKDAREADSLVIRNSAWKQYTEGAMTRLAPGGGVLYVGTRWHEDDPAGRIERKAGEGGRPFRTVRFAAIAEEDEPHRKRGEALHPARYDLPWLETQAIELGARSFAALYQQRPTPEAGNRYKRTWIQTYAAAPVQMAITADEVAITVDCASRKNEDNDWTVMQVWARKGVAYYLLDQVRARMVIGEQFDAFRRLCAKWPTAGVKLIETKSNGEALYQIVSKVFGGCIPIDPRNGKLERSKFAERAWEAMQVWLPSPEHAGWIGDFIEECCAFPLAPHDDQVDAMSQLLERWAGEGGANALQRARERLAIVTAMAGDDPWA